MTAMFLEGDQLRKSLVPTSLSVHPLGQARGAQVVEDNSQRLQSLEMLAAQPPGTMGLALLG